MVFNYFVEQIVNSQLDLRQQNRNSPTLLLATLLISKGLKFELRFFFYNIFT